MEVPTASRAAELVMRPIGPPPGAPFFQRQELYCRVAGLEKEVFGSVTFSFEVLLPVAPSLWQEASKIVISAKTKPAASSIRFRI